MNSETRIFLNANDEIGCRAPANVVVLTLGATMGGQVIVHLPYGDDDALAVLERLEAVIDNAVSAVRLRERERGLRTSEAADPSLGAGGSVEAYRG